MNFRAVQAFLFLSLIWGSIAFSINSTEILGGGQDEKSPAKEGSFKFKNNLHFNIVSLTY